MKVVRKSILRLSSPVPVYDIETEEGNFCLSNGVVVHNSKDIWDAVSGAVYSCYLDIDHAGQLSNKYRINKHSELLEIRNSDPMDTYDRQMRGLF